MAAPREYVCCPQCGEAHRRALRRDGRCFNCADTTHAQGTCTVCGCVAPVEDHHVAGRRQAPDTLPVCLNCHGILSHYQRYWHPDWQQGTRPALFLMQGYADLLHLLETRSHTGPGAPPKPPALAMLALVIVAIVVCLAVRCYHQEPTTDTDGAALVTPWRYP